MPPRTTLRRGIRPPAQRPGVPNRSKPLTGGLGHPAGLYVHGRVMFPWLNLVERWFAELTDKKPRRGAHRSAAELNRDIRAWIDTWNQNPRPSVSAKTAD
jgi:hypothetical protein